jgi:thymidylate synthase
MNNVDTEYFRLLNLVLSKGRIKSNRTGINTIGIFGAQARFNLQEGFPILTTKKVFFRSVVHELLWFISGSTNIKYLVDNDVHIWDDWAYVNFLKNMPPKADHDKHLRNPTKEEFVKLIKNDDFFAKQYGELGEGTYGGMWRAFPFHDNSDPMGRNCPLRDKNSIFDAHYESSMGYGCEIGHVDQLKNVIDKLKTDPDDRRLIISAWHPYWVNHCALPPCHVLFQFYTELLTDDERNDIATEEQKQSASSVAIDSYDKTETYFNELTRLKVPTRRLNCQLYQRSCDLFIGIPFNISSYSLLIHMVSHVTNMLPGEFIHTYGDLHIYTNHIEQVKLQLNKKSYENLPTLKINPNIQDLFKFKYEDIELKNYQCHPYIKADIAV